MLQVVSLPAELSGKHDNFLVPRGTLDCFTKERKKVKSLSSVRLFATPWTVAYQAPPSMGFSRQEFFFKEELQFFFFNLVYFLSFLIRSLGFPGGSDGKESGGLQSGRPGFDPWVGTILCRKIWQPTLVFLPGESPWTEEPGGLQFMRSQRVRHDWATKHLNKLNLHPREYMYYTCIFRNYIEFSPETLNYPSFI